MKSEISAIEIYKEAWKVFKKAPGYLILAVIIVLVATSATSLIGELAKDDMVMYTITTIISIGISGVLSLGFIDLVLQVIKTGTVDISRIFNKIELLPSYMIAYIVYIFAVIIGTFALIIPGIFILLKFSMFPYVLASKNNIAPIDSLKRSWNILKGHFLDLIVFILFSIIIFIIGIIPCGMGLIIVIPVIAISYGLFYLELEKDYKRQNENLKNIVQQIE